MIEARAMELAAALRSGRYTQTKHQLRNGNGFCCLGVACDLFNNEKWVDHRYLDEDIVMPTVVKDHFGFKDNIGGLPGIITINREQVSTLAGLNDLGWTFAQIADFIEARWADL